MPNLLFEFLTDRKTKRESHDALLPFNDALFRAYRADTLPDWRKLGPAFIYVAHPVESGRPRDAYSFKLTATGSISLESGVRLFPCDMDAGESTFAIDWRSDMAAASLYRTAIVASYTAHDKFEDVHLEHLALPFLDNGKTAGILGAIAYEDITSAILRSHDFGPVKRRTRTRRLSPPFNYIFQKAAKLESRLWRSFNEAAANAESPSPYPAGMVKLA